MSLLFKALQTLEQIGTIISVVETSNALVFRLRELHGESLVEGSTTAESKS